MEQIRVVKEMREHDKGNGRTGELVRPRYMVWENVPGAFSSNGGQTSKPFWRSLCASSNQTLLYLDLRTGSGRKQDLSSETVGASRGEPMTRNTGESRNAAEEFALWQTLTATPQVTLCLNVSEKPNAPAITKLSQVLEENPDRKYYLSAKACQGILNRAARHNKKLPETLEQALCLQSQGV